VFQQSLVDRVEQRIDVAMEVCRFSLQCVKLLDLAGKPVAPIN
jgi:hypothetical protein